MKHSSALPGLLVALSLSQPALANPDHLALPTVYDNAGAGTVWGQTFVAESPSTLGASWYFGDPTRPNLPSVNGLEGIADLVLLDASDLASPVEIARTRVQDTGGSSFGLTTFMFSAAATTVVGTTYFIGIDTQDPYGVGLRDLSASTYSGGAQSHISGNVIEVSVLGRDTSFAVVSGPIPEPSSYALLGVGLLFLAAAARRQKQKSA